MQRLTGVAKFMVMWIVLATMAPSIASSEIYRDACIDESFVFTYVTPTIQTIAVKKGEEGGKSRLLRGKIEMLSVGGKFIAGYLSTRFFVDDDLVGLAGEYDLEGFFILEKEAATVHAGLDGLSFFRFLDENYGVESLDYLSSREAAAMGDCHH